jgi:hypothetical protein
MSEKHEAPAHAEAGDTGPVGIGLGPLLEEIQAPFGLCQDLVVIHPLEMPDGAVEIAVFVKLTVIDIGCDRRIAGVGEALGQTLEMIVHAERLDIDHHAGKRPIARRTSVIGLQPVTEFHPFTTACHFRAPFGCWYAFTRSWMR